MLTMRPVLAAATSRSVCRHRNAGICRTSATSAAGAACEGSWMSVRIGTPSRALIAAEHAQPLVEAGAAKRAARRAVRLVVGGLEDERHRQPCGHVARACSASSTACASLSMTHGPAMQHERAAAAERQRAKLDGDHAAHYRQVRTGSGQGGEMPVCQPASATRAARYRALRDDRPARPGSCACSSPPRTPRTADAASSAST